MSGGYTRAEAQDEFARRLLAELAPTRREDASTAEKAAAMEEVWATLPRPIRRALPADLTAEIESILARRTS